MVVHNHHHLSELQLEGGGEQTRARTFRVSLSLLGTLLGGSLLLVSVVAEYIFDTKEQAELMAMLAAVLLAAPIIKHALQSLLTGHSHMDELVALAIVASFAIGEYRTAGAVAFFMLLAELIEARTALGARASIESLIRITPTKAVLVHRDGGETETEAALLKPGQVIRR